MGFRVSNNYGSFYDAPGTATTSDGAVVESPVAATSTKTKLPPIDDSVTFTALGVDTEYKLAQAAYMAAAAKAGIADVNARREFAAAMLANNPPNLTLKKGGVELDDAKVKSRLFNQTVEYVLSTDDKRALENFRAQYAAAGGRIRFNRTPTIDLRQAGTADAVDSAPVTPQNDKFRVLLNNTGNPRDARRILAQYVQDRRGGGNLWGDNYVQIANLSIGQSVQPKITNLTRVGNKIAVEFTLTPLDRAKIEENYKIVQTEVNRAVAIYEDFANNNELASFLRGLFNGALGSIKGTIGLLNLPETMKALWQIVSSPRETFDALYKELGETWEAFKQAPPNKKAEMVGEVIGAAVVEILIGKGIGKAGSILQKTKTGAKILEKADNLKSVTVAKIAETFSDEAAQAATSRLRGRLQATTLYAGIPADALADLAIVSANKIKNGAIKFGEFSRQMIDEVGDKVKPHLEKLYRERMTELGLAEKIDEAGISAANKAERIALTATGQKAVTQKTLEHIFHGEINSNGKAVGFHYEGPENMQAVNQTRVIESSRSVPDKNGVYTAKVEVNGVAKLAPSSFFPRNWSKNDVVNVVNEAYSNKTFPKPNNPLYFEGRTQSGILIGGYLNKDGTIATAFPLYGR